jgi:hypothetical protein
VRSSSTSYNFSTNVFETFSHRRPGQRLCKRLYKGSPLRREMQRRLVACSLRVPSMARLALFAALLSAVSYAFAAPVLDLQARAATAALSTADISTFVPYIWFARTAYCTPRTTITWKCGGTSKPYALAHQGPQLA